MTRPFESSEDKLVLETFKDIERQILGLLPDLPWIRLLVRGLLKALEGRWISVKVQSSVEGAVKAYRATEEPSTGLVDRVVVTEQPSAVSGLPELRMTSTFVERP